MTHWQEFSPADFDAKLAPRGAAKRAAEAARAGRAGLFFAATPVARPAKSGTDDKRIPEDVALFGAEDETGDQL